MGYGYSLDLRKRVVAAYERGDGTFEEVGKTFGVGEATVNRWVQLKRRSGSLAPRPHGGGHPTPFDASGLERL